jgi:hypothetical protein
LERERCRRLTRDRHTDREVEELKEIDIDRERERVRSVKIGRHKERKREKCKGKKR